MVFAGEGEVRCGYKYTLCWTFPRVIPIRERHQGSRIPGQRRVLTVDPAIR